MIRVGLGLIVFIFLPALVARAQEPAADAASSSPRQVPEELSFANGLLRERKFDLAALEYQRFLDSQPAGQDAADARFGLATARLFQGRYKEAKQAFQQFLEQAPRHRRARTAWYRLGELSYMLGNLPEARQALETFVAGAGKHPNLETAWTYLGDVRFGLDDLKGARTAYERSLVDFPHGQLVDRSRYGLGRSLAGLGETESALKVLNELATQGSTDWVDRAWFQIGRIQLAAGRDAAAVEAFQTLDRVAPRSSLKSEAALSRAEALAHLNRASEAEKLLIPLTAEGGESLAPRAALVLATLRLQQRAARQALAVLDEAVKRFPHSALMPALQFRSAEALEQLKQIPEARKRYVQIAQTAPRDPWADDALARAAKLALEERDHAAALALARSFPERFPQSPHGPEVRAIEGRALLAGGQPKEAVRILEPLVGPGKDPGMGNQSRARSNLDPAVAEAARYDLALAYRATGQSARADALLASLAGGSHDKVGSDAQFLIGQERIEKGRFAEAIEPLNAYLSKNPDGEVAEFALAQLATAQLGLGKKEEAWKTLGRLADRWPRSKVLPPTRLRLAESALDGNEPPRAAEQFRLVLADTPDGSKATDRTGSARGPLIDPAVRKRALLGLGRALWKLGKPAEAAPCFADFLKTYPDDSNVKVVALDHAGALEAAGQTDAALTAYRQLVENHPQTKEALQADLARARLLARTGRPGEAAAVFGSLLADHGQEQALEALGTKRDDLLAERGWALVDVGKISDADALFRELLKTHPQSAHALEARFNLAESASQARDYPEVVRLLAPVLDTPAASGAGVPKNDSDPTRSRFMPLVLYRLGRTHVELGDWAEAEKVLGRLVHDYPKSPKNREARLLEAEASLRLEHGAAAEKLLTALETEPADRADFPGFA
ncbi:MAG: tetratricopeptide repeat protein, partial [Isosphaeraceae bacterium]